MALPPEHATRHAYHFTHLDNLKAVLTHGFLSFNEQTRLGVRHTSIALPEIQARRAAMPVTCGPQGVVHDYVPLYFCKRSPMVLQVVRARNVDQMRLLHFAFPASILDRADVVFTDVAANAARHPTFYADPSHLQALNWSAIDSPKWGAGDEKPERMAEVLVHKRLDPRDAAFVLVWNGGVKAQVEAVYAEAGISPPPIRYEGPGEYHFFTHYRSELPDDMRNVSIAPGPRETRHAFDQAIAHIVSERGKATNPRFASLAAMLDRFQRVGLSALPETNELIGLETDNRVHKENVGDHTLKVVRSFSNSPEFGTLASEEQKLVHLAAYLHDIGKGPKSRWAKCGGKQQEDAAHPLRSVEMLKSILTESVGTVDDAPARSLCKLVCYHDLVGDIVGKGRNREQLAEIAENPRDLEMLIALGAADASSISASWVTNVRMAVPSLRRWVLGQLPAKPGV